MKSAFEQFHDVFDDLYEGVYFVDRDRGITFWNQGAVRITGFTSQEMLGHFCYDNLLNHVDEQGNQLCMGGCPLHATLQDGNARSAQVYLHHKSGHRVRVNVRIRPLVLMAKSLALPKCFPTRTPRSSST